MSKLIWHLETCAAVSLYLHESGLPAAARLRKCLGPELALERLRPASGCAAAGWILVRAELLCVCPILSYCPSSVLVACGLQHTAAPCTGLPAAALQQGFRTARLISLLHCSLATHGGMSMFAPFRLT